MARAACRGEQGAVGGAGGLVELANGRVADAAFGRVDDALEGEVVGLVGNEPEIGEGVADFEALVEARAADDAVVESERDEALFELAHLVGGADEDGDVVEI